MLTLILDNQCAIIFVSSQNILWVSFDSSGLKRILRIKTTEPAFFWKRACSKINSFWSGVGTRGWPEETIHPPNKKFWGPLKFFQKKFKLSKTDEIIEKNKKEKIDLGINFVDIEIFFGFS